MSECVVRMEFRKNCLDCDLHQIVYGDSYADIDVYCFKTKRFVGKRFGPAKDLARPSWCPIICQLPAGHGRLGDLDELLNLMFHYDDYCGAKEAHDVDLIHRDSICYAIENAPTIVPATEGGKA